MNSKKLILILLLMAAFALSASPALAESAPGAVSSVSLARGDGTVTASWDAPSGATEYHVTYSDNGGSSWTAAARPGDGHSASTITFSVDNAKTYIVGVRAGNHVGWSTWRNSAPSGPYVPPKPAPAPSVFVERGKDGVSATVKWTAYAGSDFSYYQVIVCSDAQYDGSSCSGTVYKSGAIYDAASTGPVSVTGLDAQTGYGVILQTWRTGGALKSHATIPALPPAAPAGLTAAAGNASVTLTWDDPADDSITGYEYRVNHNDTSTGNLSGWGPWQAIDDSAAAVSHTIDGLTNGSEYRFKLRAVNSGGPGAIAPAADPWYVAATPKALAAPTGLTVTPSGGNLTVSWDAVTGATGYDVRSSTDGSTWTTEHSNVSDTSVSVADANGEIEQIGVRARNAGGAGDWTTKKRMPPSDWLTTVQQSGASAQAQSQLAAPAWGTITRDNGRKHVLHLNWTSVNGATGYNVVCSDSDGWRWWQCGAITSGSTTTLTVDSYPNGGQLAKYRSYKVAVRAVNSNPSDASSWTNSENIRPVQRWLRNLVSTRGNGSITLSWTPNPWTTGYQVDCAIHEYGKLPAYTRCATLTGQDDTAASHSVTIPHSTNSTYIVDNTKTYEIRIISTNQWDTGGNAQMFAPLVNAPSMSAADIGQTTAKLKIASYTGAWWYKRTAPTGDSTCHGIAAGTTEVSLSGLTAGVAYTYKAYDTTNCNNADEIASLSFSTAANVGNLSQVSDGFGVLVYGGYSPAAGFTTGDNASGYTLQSVTAKFRAKRGSPRDFEAAIHASASGNPATLATCTLSGDEPVNAQEYTFTSSGSCVLAKDRTYYLVMTATGTSSDYYSWDTTASGSQTNSPSDFGWEIDDDTKLHFNNAWTSQSGYVGMLKVAATLNSNLTVSDVVGTGATLTIDNYTGFWWYKTSDSGAACQGPVNGASQALTLLTIGATYAYSAYSDSECSALLATASSFTTPSIAVSGIGQTSAAALMSNYGGQQWWYRADSGPHVNCQGPAATRSPVTLSGLTKGTPYQYLAFSKSGCNSADRITTVFFTTAAVILAVSNIADTTATLAIAGHTGSNWYYQADATPDNTCQGPVSTTSKNLTGLTSGASYVYQAFSDSACTTANLLATASSFTTGASHVTNLHSVRTGQSIIASDTKQAVAFTTGANANGYTLNSITAPLRRMDANATLTVTLHAMSGGGTYSRSSVPSDTALATLSGTGPSSAGWADTTFTCSGSECSLSANTTYFIVAQGGRTNSHAWAVATTSSESGYPSNHGWDIGYAHDKEPGGRPWYSPGDYHPVRVDFATPTLAASSVSATGATLTIGGYSGAWWYKSATTGKTTCESAGSGTSVTVSGLTAGTAYVFTAYSDSSCATSIVAAPSFTTLTTLTVSNVGTTTARITIAGHTGQWWYLADTGPHTTCQGPVAAGTAYKDLTGLTAGSFYVYSAYSATGCADTVKLATAGVSTAVTASNLSGANVNAIYSIGTYTQGFTTGNADATLLSMTVDFGTQFGSTSVTLRAAQSNGQPDKTTTLATLTGSAGSGQKTFTCVDGGSNDCSLEANTTYFIYLSGGSGNLHVTEAAATLSPAGNGWSFEQSARFWSSGNLRPGSRALKLEVEAVPHEELTASSVTATGATLTIKRHLGDWWYKSTTTGQTTCTSAGSVTSVSLTLTAGTSYTFSAYSDSTCTTANLLATAAQFTTP